MADFSINLGDIFLLDTGAPKYHWYVAIAPFSSEEFVFVSISTWREGSRENDGTCILRPSQKMPRFIQNKSFTAYQFARHFTANQLENYIASGSEIPYDKLDSLILRRIQKESLKAKNLKKKYLRAVQNCIGIS